MARRKTKTPRRRSPKTVSLIDVGASFIVANAGTRAFFGTGVVPFLSEGWLTDATAGWMSRSPGNTGSGQSYTLSLAELVKQMIPGGADAGASSYSFAGMSGISAAVKRNLQEWGPQAIATTIVTPIAAKLLKRVARKPIADVNKLLKWGGVQSLGVKV